jgi:hypothetical protein
MVWCVVAGYCGVPEHSGSRGGECEALGPGLIAKILGVGGIFGGNQVEVALEVGLIAVVHEEAGQVEEN